MKNKLKVAKLDKREIELNQSIIVERLRRKFVALQLILMLRFEQWN